MAGRSQRHHCTQSRFGCQEGYKRGYQRGYHRGCHRRVAHVNRGETTTGLCSCAQLRALENPAAEASSNDLDSPASTCCAALMRPASPCSHRLWPGKITARFLSGGGVVTTCVLVTVTVVAPPPVYLNKAHVVRPTGLTFASVPRP
ncbi:hypothetical protein P152DRAFT_461134 [Eremomyces bilateralis CBS 781.70]|uniref:Uncharacterized protein n=1 Tax=Eremomyces bilateralis CBS 781.70 TaxID=1392243 RepID=A0A6G1FVL5_9PEZI|nr:uncharacterized protein P152DRAFT_461134 [Eremomyces bilateralis CBS 781.70]KAF1809746.1 hypothetical protein P152DRAFT_461134 [Eremomyces bilateralis CBS 781.70]